MRTISLAAAAASGQGRALGDEREVVRYSTDKNRIQLLPVINGERSQEDLWLLSLSAPPSQDTARQLCTALHWGIGQ